MITAETGVYLQFFDEGESFENELPPIGPFELLIIRHNRIIGDREDIEHDLEETRSRGYAVNRGEFRLGVCGIASPVRDRGGGVVAAIGVWGAEKSILGTRREELAHMTVAAARDISREMGFVEVTTARQRVLAAEPA